MYKIIHHNMAKHHINDGDILFFKPSTICDSFCKAIVNFTKATYTHAGIVFNMKVGSCDESILMVLENFENVGRRIVSFNHYYDRNIDVISPIVPWKDVGTNLIPTVGCVGYSWYNAAYIGLREALYYNFGISTPGIKHGEVCSKFVAKTQKLTDITVSPHMLYKLLLDNGSTFKLKIRTANAIKK